MFFFLSTLEFMNFVSHIFRFTKNRLSSCLCVIVN
jgi:hypothetical protein